jgi:NDP-sugar pyrophosphorylase family protein
VHPPRLTVALITAAGFGSRFFGSSTSTDLKPLQPINGRRIIDYVVAFARAAAHRVVVAVPQGWSKTFSDLCISPPNVAWAEYPQGIGVVETLQLMVVDHAEDANVLAMLGDDISIMSNPGEFLVPVWSEGAYASQGTVPEADPVVLADTCEVVQDGNRVLRVTERPQPPTTSVRGCGVYGFAPDAARELSKVDTRTLPGLCQLFTAWAQQDRDVRAVPLLANININWPRDLERAVGVVRDYDETIAAWEGGPATLSR